MQQHFVIHLSANLNQWWILNTTQLNSSFFFHKSFDRAVFVVIIRWMDFFFVGESLAPYGLLGKQQQHNPDYKS